MVVEANTLPNHETKVGMAVPVAAVAMAVKEGFNYCQETKLSRRGKPEKWQGSYSNFSDYNNQSSNFDPWKEETLEAEALAPMLVEANTLPSHETKVATAVPAAAVAVAVAEGFN